MINYSILRANYNTEEELSKYEIRLFKLIYYTSLTRSFCVIYYDTIVLTYTVMCTFIYIKFNAENAMQTTKIIIMIY